MIELSATQAVAAMARGEMTAEAYARALLAQCDKGRALNAFITLEPEGVLAAARAADRMRASGAALGPMHGLPVPVKDSVNTADLPTTAGTNALRGWTPAADAPAVARLKAAGAFVLGKTNLHELSFGWTSNNLAFGPVRNPYDPSRIPGGSTGGTAAAVAARMAPLGVAEDTQGSIRVPAALCGIAGFRPTTGRYPTEGTAPITPVFDQIGPHARDVEDLVLFDAVMTGDAAPIAAADPRAIRLGVVRDYYFAGLDPAVEAVTDTALGRLRDAGVTLVEVAAPGLADLIARATMAVQAHDAASALSAYLAASGAPVGLDEVVAQVSADIRRLWDLVVLPGAPMAISDEAYADAVNVHRPALQRLFADLYAAEGLSALVFPATMTAATPIGEAETVMIAGEAVPFTLAISRNISPGSTAGAPGLVLPAGLTPDGLPVGLEFDGPAGADRALLGAGLTLERLLGRLPAPVLALG